MPLARPLFPLLLAIVIRGLLKQATLCNSVLIIIQLVYMMEEQLLPLLLMPLGVCPVRNSI